MISACFRPGTLLIASLVPTSFAGWLPLARGLTTFCLVTALADEVGSNSFSLRALAAPRKLPTSFAFSSSSLATPELPPLDDDPTIANLDRSHAATNLVPTANLPNRNTRRMPPRKCRTKSGMAAKELLQDERSKLELANAKNLLGSKLLDKRRLRR